MASTKGVCSLAGFEDDIVISYCLSQLVPEEALAADVDESKETVTLPPHNRYAFSSWTGYLSARWYTFTTVVAGKSRFYAPATRTAACFFRKKLSVPQKTCDFSHGLRWKAGDELCPGTVEAPLERTSERGSPVSDLRWFICLCLSVYLLQTASRTACVGACPTWPATGISFPTSGRHFWDFTVYMQPKALGVAHLENS